MHHIPVCKLAALISAAFLLSACGQDKPAAGGPGMGGPAEVGVEVVREEAVSITTLLPGRTSAYTVAEIRPQVGGIIQKRAFTEGADVKAGEVLYQIDPATFQAAYDSAKAALARSEASLVTTQAKAKRYRELIEINAISKQDLDDINSLEKQTAAEVAANKANLETARINLGYTRVVSPISGRIGKSSVTQGALVTANQAAALATVQHLDKIYVDVTQSSVELLRLKNELASGKLQKSGDNGAKVKLKLEDGSMYPETGVLQFSDVTVDQNTGSVTLRAVFPNPKRVLLPGMYVRAVLEEGVNNKAILASQQGVSRDAKGNATALVVGKDDKVEPRVLKTSHTHGENWVVSEGLQAGDRLIVSGLQKIRPGMQVKVTSAVAASATASAAASK